MPRKKNTAQGAVRPGSLMSRSCTGSGADFWLICLQRVSRNKDSVRTVTEIPSHSLWTLLDSPILTKFKPNHPKCV
uniref:Uncharacterized protein n=1 Tax=Malurus cyaneus samueli TaxID=2593467 RepID=A0A8C5TD77_9PASS